MQHTATTHPRLFVTMAIALVATVAIFALSFTRQPLSLKQGDIPSWTLRGGSKVPLTNQNPIEPHQVVQPVGVSWATNAGSKAPMVVPSSETELYELIEGVPWAAHGGSKVPAFGFVQ